VRKNLHPPPHNPLCSNRKTGWQVRGLFLGRLNLKFIWVERLHISDPSSSQQQTGVLARLVKHFAREFLVYILPRTYLSVWKENSMSNKNSDKTLDLAIQLNKGQIDFHISLRLIRAILISLLLALTIILTLLTVRDPKTWTEVLHSFLFLSHLILELIDESTSGTNLHCLE
jgi:hypothetical protein